MIKPHGDKLVNQVLPADQSNKILENIDQYESLIIDHEQIKDAKNIARGAYSPLTGFLGKKDFESVTEKMRLADGVVWPIPIVLDISAEDKKKINKKES